ncbi:hypothetical protein G3N56_07880 [Desulfovibrio sulfodismutans]|uniref:Uncharacterized protein n=1 Tax=Desulfolutivibrio sulfodismutans TaxID=63561 RepID=A0A7K3NKD1_9BACT|nr:hypothetical protein [Desulfolutivibrio sulfodismutans]NDY56661.1 hypothetical protein [Desulfolutivibrio sulfodismutans]QLA11239.1 hypothetical protein GD606_02580 [Desulfolutivibrio sulfodismutans DSM 3696]
MTTPARPLHNVTPVFRAGVAVERFHADVLVIAGTAPGWLADVDITLDRLSALGLRVHLLAVNRAIAEISTTIDHAATVHPGHLRGWLEAGGCVGDQRPLTHGPALSGSVDVAWPSPVSLGGSSHLAVLAGLGLGYPRLILAGVCLDTGTPYEPMQKLWWRDCNAFADRVRCASRGWLRTMLGAPDAEWLEV